MSKLVHLINEIYKLNSLIPISPKSRKELLQVIQERTNYYTPKISKLAGVELSIPEVRDADEFYDDLLLKLRDINSLNLGRIPDKLDEIGLNLEMGAYYMRGVIPFFIKRNLINEKFLMQYESSKIYIKFNQFNLKSLINRPIRDTTIAHEICHHLYYTIGGKEADYKNDKPWSEGFAHFLSENYFSKIYDFDPINKIRKGYRQKGYERMCWVAVFKPQDILNVPKKWKELEKEYQEYTR